MEVDAWKAVSTIFWLIIVIEIISVAFWWLITEYDTIGTLVYIITFVTVFSGTIAIIVYRRHRKKLPQFDERLQKHYDRSIMIAGIASLAVLLQITVVEIITGLNFRAIEILVAVGTVFYVVVAAAYIVQSRSG
ncbi:MAG: hypothetical protein ACFFD4_04795 [Candidatus Odinarchaeota archaeon]